MVMISSLDLAKAEDLLISCATINFLGKLLITVVAWILFRPSLHLSKTYTDCPRS